jgi:hypothetical protein
MSTYIKIETAAADLLLNVLDKQNGAFFVACPIQLASSQERQLQS